MHAVTEFQARVIIVAERDRLDSYYARVREANKEGEKITRDERSQELSDRKGRDKLAELLLLE